MDGAFLVEEVRATRRRGTARAIRISPARSPTWLITPPLNLVITGFYIFTPTIFHGYHLVQPSERGEYEISDAIDPLIQGGRMTDAIPLSEWRVDVGYPEDRKESEARLEEEFETNEVAESRD